MELRLPISNVGVRISAVFPRKQRVSALTVPSSSSRRCSFSRLAHCSSSRLRSLLLLPSLDCAHCSFSRRCSSSRFLFSSALESCDAAPHQLTLQHISRVVSLSRIGMGRRLSACESHSTSVSELVKVAGTPGRGFCVSSLSIFPRGCAQQKQSRFDRIRGGLSLSLGSHGMLRRLLFRATPEMGGLIQPAPIPITLVLLPLLYFSRGASSSHF